MSVFELPTTTTFRTGYLEGASCRIRVPPWLLTPPQPGSSAQTRTMFGLSGRDAVAGGAEAQAADSAQATRRLAIRPGRGETRVMGRAFSHIPGDRMGARDPR
jgi:hypothetical protein